jgi:exonuclease SbcC
MKLKRMDIKSIGVHRDTSIPVDQLADKDRLVAITGENGAGKTTALECGPGVIYGKCPSRGVSLAALANDRASSVAATYEIAGEDIGLRVKINAVAKARPTEWFLTVDGRPLDGVDGRKVDYMREVRARLPSEDVYLASAFGAQRAGGFLDMKPAARKALFAELLGIDRLDEIAGRCGERLKACEDQLKELRGRRSQLAHPGATPLSDLRDNLAATDASIQATESEVAELEAEAEASRKDMEKWAATDADLRLKGAEAKAALEAVTTKRQNLREEINRLKVGITAREAAIRRRRAALVCEGELRRTIDATEGAEGELASLLASESEYAAEQREHQTALREWESAKAKAESMADRAKRSLRDAEARAAMVSSVPCHGEDGCSACPLLTDAIVARDAIDNLRSTLHGRVRVVEEVEASKPADLDWPDMTDKIAEARKLVDDRNAAKIRLEALADAKERIAEDELALGLALGDVEEANERLAGIRAEVATAKDTLEAATVAWRAHKERHPHTPEAWRLRDARNELSQLQSDAGRLAAEIARAEKDAGDLFVVEEQIEDLARDVDDWAHLKTAFGVKIKALEIDASGPEVSRIANDLLHGCYGTRFTVSLITTDVTTKGGQKEVFELRVIDTEKGWEGDAAQLSGGERVLVGEAFALAIAIFNKQRSSIPMDDLFRDEVAGALSVGNGPRYIAMLRAAMDVGGFSRCYFVTHSPPLAAMADAEITFTESGCRLK